MIPPMSGTLFLVGTPIGNLDDLTDRARRTLGEVDVVAAEDTRRTGRLLEAIGVRKPLLSFFDENESARVPQLVQMLRDGRDVALVTDAGMPSVSDPGYRLVSACVEGGIAVDVVPGPSAALAALVVSGLPTDRFVFEGFLPRSGGSRRSRLEALAAEPRTMVLFESPQRVAKTVAKLRAALGDERRAAVCRELTKLHQEVLRGTLAELAEVLASRDVRGEVVVVVEGAPDVAGSLEEAVERARALVSSGSRKRDAAKEAARVFRVTTSDVYSALTRTSGEVGSK